MFDAYTVKKVLPRLLIAVILIQLSWPLFTLLIVVVSNVAWGLEGLLYAPFGGRDELEITKILQEAVGPVGLTLTGLVGGTAVVGGTAFALGGGVGLLLLGASILLALAIAFFVLAIRQILIVVLVVSAPLALVAWILPGTDKLWKIWWESFSKVLLMYPLILLIVAGGRVAARIAASPDVYGNGAFKVGIILLAFYGPYFLIPKTFQVAGSAFANIAGIANNRSRGMFDRLRNARQERAKQLHENRMNASTRLGSGRTGSLYRRAASLGANGSWSLSSRGRNRWKDQEQAVLERAAAEKLEKGGARAFNDDDASKLLRDTSMTRREFVRQYQAMGHTQQEAEMALARAESAVGARVGTTGMAVAAQKFRVAHTNTAYEAGEEGLAQMQEELNQMVNAGLITAYDAAGWMKANKGRAEFSSNSYGSTVDFVQKKISAGDQIEGAFAGADPREVLGSHQRTVETFAAQSQKLLSDALETGDQRAIDKALADVGNLHSMLSSVSPKKAEEFANNVFAMSTGETRTVPVRGADGEPAKDAAGNTITQSVELNVRQLLDEARINPQEHPDFHNRVREYASARDNPSIIGPNAAGETVQPPDGA